MACELFAARYRTFAGTIDQNFWAVGACFLALLAYPVQNWVHLQLIVSLLGLLTIPLYWYVAHTRSHSVIEYVIKTGICFNRIFVKQKVSNFYLQIQRTEALIPVGGLS